VDNKQFDKILHEIQKQCENTLNEMQTNVRYESADDVALCGILGLKDITIYCAGVRASLEDR